MRGVLNDAVSVFLDATLTSAFVARWCAGYKVETAEGVFRVRADERWRGPRRACTERRKPQARLGDLGSKILRAFAEALFRRPRLAMKLSAARQPTGYPSRLQQRALGWKVGCHIPHDGNKDVAALEIRAFLLDTFDRQQEIGAAARLVARHLILGHSPEALIATLAHALLREDAGFHAYQMLEAGVRQFHEWGNCDHVTRIAWHLVFLVRSKTGCDAKARGQGSLHHRRR